MPLEPEPLPGMRRGAPVSPPVPADRPGADKIRRGLQNDPHRGFLLRQVQNQVIVPNTRVGHFKHLFTAIGQRINTSW